MREEVISSGTVEAVALAASSPPPTPAASSVAVSSHIVPANAGSTDCLGSAQSSKAGSLSSAAAHASWTSMSNNVGNSTAGSSEILCRPWERGDLLRRLATFELSNWFGKPKGANSLACARRGWVNIGFDKIECELCGSCLTLTTSASQTTCEEAFAEKLDSGHAVMCPWRGNVCADSLVQFPPNLASALIGGYKDRCDELTQFPFLPVIASYVVEFMRLSRSEQIDCFLSQSLFLLGEMGFNADNMPVVDLPRENSSWHHSQRIISLCGWEPRWLPNVQDCEEYSAQSARNTCSTGPKEDGYHHSRLAELSKNTLASIEKKNQGKEKLVLESRCNLSSLLLDCSLCGVTIRVSDFLTIPRQTRYGLINNSDPGTFKKLVQTHGTSAASGISGCLGEDGLEEQQENRDETATTDFRKSSSNTGVHMNIATTEIFPSIQPAMLVDADPSDDGGMGRDLTLGQPAESEVGDRAASFESRGPCTRKRSIEEGGSTVDRPQDRAQRADSIEGTVVDHDVDEFDGCSHESGLSKRARRLEAFNSPNLSQKMDFSGAGPSHGYFGMTINRLNSFKEGSDLAIRHSATRDSAHASSVVAMDTICGSDDEDSMESVENHPRDFDGTNLNSIMNVSEYNYSNLAQHSTCVLHASGSVARDIGGSSTIDGEEVLNKETFAANARDMFSIGISGGSVGMVASQEAEIQGVDVSLHQAHSDVGDAELIAEVTENVVQCGESAAGPGLMDESGLDVLREDIQNDIQDMMSRSIVKADSGSKVHGSIKTGSIESGERLSHALGHGSVAIPSHSGNAMECSGNKISKGKLTRNGKETTGDDCDLGSDDVIGNSSGPQNEDNIYKREAAEFDPIKHHSSYCPWVNGNVAAAGANADIAFGSSGAVALTGWQLTLDALDAFLSLGHIPNQILQSDSAASLYKDDHFNHTNKILTQQSAIKSKKKHVS